MDLYRSKRNVKIAQKYLYSQQLLSYSRLCKLYEQIVRHLGREGSSGIADYLSKAANAEDFQNLSYLRNSGFSPEIRGLIQEYSHESQILKSFKEGSARLYEALTYTEGEQAGIPKPFVDEDNITAFHDFMEEAAGYLQSTRFENSYKNLLVRRPVTIGMLGYDNTLKSIERINSVDSSHIPLSMQTHISKDVTPADFGSVIHGYKSGKKYSREQEEKKAHREYRDYVDGEENIYKTPEDYTRDMERTYPVRTFFTKNRDKIRQIAKRITVFGLAAVASISLISAGITQYKISQADAFDNYQSGYQTVISQETVDELQAIHNMIDTAKAKLSQGQDASQDIRQIARALDVSADNVVEELIHQSVETYYSNEEPGSKVVFVPGDGSIEQKTTHYFADSSGRDDSIYLHYIVHHADGTQDEHEETFSAGIGLTEYFNGQYYINHNDSYDLDKLIEISENADHLGGVKFEYSPKKGIFTRPKIKTAVPDKIEDKTSQQQDDEMELG